MTPRGEARRAMALTLSFDVAVAAVSMGLALLMRWGLVAGASQNPAGMALMAALIFAFSAFFAFWVVGVHRQVWRHMGWVDVVRVMQAVGLATLFFLPVLFLWNRLVGFPRSSILIAAPVWLLIILTARMIAIARSTQRPLQIFRSVGKDAPLVVLAGDNECIARVLRDLSKSPDGGGVRMLGVIEVDAIDPGRAIRGVTVLGDLNDLGNVLDVLSVRYGTTPWVAVTGAARDRRVMTRILEETSARGSKVMALEAEADQNRFHRVRAADLLSRAERDLDITPVAKLIGGANVLVTGAGGTIGSELVRQSARLSPARLALYDASEYNLYRIDLEMRREEASSTELSTFLGDVRDVPRLVGAMNAIAPDVVIHAAALKHVPLMEKNVCEAILTNVGGTVNAARAAAEAGVKHFVLISTDKAVDPDNVMGATKRLAEIAVSRIAEQSGMEVAMVRFGNVLGSSGSVVPLFQEQIAAGGPVTVTDPDVTRYFMTVEEASALVLQAASLNGRAKGRNLFVLNMGEPVKIKELAEMMIRMRGMVPGRDIAIQYTGLRPGEKLHETLTYEHEGVENTSVPGVMSVGVRAAVQPDFDTALETLLQVSASRDRVEALRLLSDLVPEYTAYGQKFRSLKRA